MSIGHIREKIKEISSQCETREIYTSLVIILTAGISFFLGRIWSSETTQAPVLVETIPMPKEPAVPAQAIPLNELKPPMGETKTKGKYVASKTGKKYHLPSCIGAKSISEANRIWFETKEEAEKAGFSPAGNCKGI